MKLPLKSISCLQIISNHGNTSQNQVTTKLDAEAKTLRIARFIFHISCRSDFQRPKQLVRELNSSTSTDSASGFHHCAATFFLGFFYMLSIAAKLALAYRSREIQVLAAGSCKTFSHLYSLKRVATPTAIWHILSTMIPSPTILFTTLWFGILVLFSSPIRREIDHP